MNDPYRWMRFLQLLWRKKPWCLVGYFIRLCIYLRIVKLKELKKWSNSNFFNTSFPNITYTEVIFFGCNLKNCCLTLSGRRSLWYRNQTVDLLCKSMDWFLYDRVLRPERVEVIIIAICLFLTIFFNYFFSRF